MFSMEQTEFTPRPMSGFFSAAAAAASAPGVTERAEPLFTKLKEEPEDLLQLAPTAGDAVIPLDFGPFGNTCFDLYRLIRVISSLGFNLFCAFVIL